jgi:hypothetical protein
MTVTPEEFDACFDRATRDVFRLETLQRYNIPGEAERIQAWRDGQPRPERSVRTSPWLRRIALTTVQGLRWFRVHLVDHPLSEYLQYQMAGYIESAAAGEEIRIADRAAHGDLRTLDTDFWLFDADSPAPYAAVMRYDDDGRWLGADYHDDTETLAWCRFGRDIALRHSVPLNVYLAEAKRTRNVA